ncbi:MAG: hypothetical protein RL757_2397 [Bacteroidota bacterium]|jgi:deoxyribodipyrimidine photo-lyase
MSEKINLMWFRRDLRLQDNAALYHALRAGRKVVPVFIFDKNILDKLDNRSDARVSFIHQTLSDMQVELQNMGASFHIFHGSIDEAWHFFSTHYDIETVFANHDYEGYAIRRDENIKTYLNSRNINFLTFKDQVIFEKLEVTKDDGKPYTVFTPYSKKWLAKLASQNSTLADEAGISYYLTPYPTEKYFSAFQKMPPPSINAFPMLENMGFVSSNIEIPSKTVARKIVRHYDETRNFPALRDGTTKLGIHFRFGTISIREKALSAQKLNATYLNELIWRDFYSQILANFPHISAGKAFRPEYDQIEWRDAPEDFQKWCDGKTGYPIVDAGMRELNATGQMHNRVRMIVSSFLTKHLLLDWRLGESYFAMKLLDYDFASNNGGWQWAAGSGTDAAPYFRIFNPTEQQKKFDAKGEYIRRWVKEYGTPQYAAPMVDHKLARERCLATYKKALQQGR